MTTERRALEILTLLYRYEKQPCRVSKFLTVYQVHEFGRQRGWSELETGRALAYARRNYFIGLTA